MGALRLYVEGASARLVREELVGWPDELVAIDEESPSG